MGAGAKIMVGLAVGAAGAAVAYQYRPEWFGLEPVKSATSGAPPSVGNPRAGQNDAKTAPPGNPLSAIDPIKAASSTVGSSITSAIGSALGGGG